MATFVLIPGAASGPGYWHLLEAELRARGHRTVAVDLPCEDDDAGLPEYADAAVAAIADDAAAEGAHDEVVLVAHSLGGFTAPLVADRIPVDELVLVTAMIATSGEAPGDWWANTGHGPAIRAELARHGVPPDEEPSEDLVFAHDVPATEAAVLAERRGQSGTPMEAPWPLAAWPDVPTRFVLCTEDRFFPAGFQRAVLADRLSHAPVVELAAGHLPMLARPGELAEILAAGHPRPAA